METSLFPSTGSRKEIRHAKKSRRKSGASPAPSTPNVKTTEEDVKKYVDHGLPGVPKNPKDGRTVPYETAICRIQAKEYGEEILDQYNEKDRDGKRIVYLAGRNFGLDTSWNLETRNAKMVKLVGGQDENTTKRFDLMLSHPADRDLFHQTIGAEENKDCYVNSGQATGKTYEQSYGEQIVAILRYVKQEGASGFLPTSGMEKLVYFFRFHLFGTCCLAAVCIFVSFLGQMAFDLERVLCPPDVGKLVRSFKDEDLYDYLAADAGGDANEVLKDMMERLGRPSCRLQVDQEGEFDDEYNLEKKFRNYGPGLVTTFQCTDEFHKAWQQNPAFQAQSSGSRATVGIIQFDMQDNQAFEDVKGVYKEFKPPRGSDNETDIKLGLESVKERNKTKTSLFQCTPEHANVATPNGARDKSAHSPQFSSNSVRTSPCRDKDAAELNEDRDESTEQLIDRERSRAQDRDRPPHGTDDEEEESASKHAMVCIATRKDKETGKRFLLLLNSWSRMPLVEVSINYFVAAGASLAFVNRNDHHILKELANTDCWYEVNKAVVADCSHAMYNCPVV